MKSGHGNRVNGATFVSNNLTHDKLPQGRSKMTPAQIAEAQKLARKWKPKLER